MPIFSKYEIGSWKFNSAPKEITDIELRASLGREIISELPMDFKTKNYGKFIAITFSRHILAVCDTLQQLNRELAKTSLKENYYIEKIGFRTIAQI